MLTGILVEVLMLSLLFQGAYAVYLPSALIAFGQHTGSVPLTWQGAEKRIAKNPPEEAGITPTRECMALRYRKSINQP